jgi:predicted O-methyltransferase YrrM
MQNLKSYFELILNFESKVTIDKCHNIFLMGALLSKKPDNVLELGIGSGIVTVSIICGLDYNQKGKLTCVDNWFDWKGKQPKIYNDIVNHKRITIIAPTTEQEFVTSAPDNEYDFLVSDADHNNSGDWVEHHLRITKHNGFMFFHDTNRPNRFPNLQQVEQKIKDRNIPYYHFTESSRPEEGCHAGWLFAINKKADN